MAKKKALITGITGQDGSYLAEFLLEKNYTVYGLERRSSQRNRGNIQHLISPDKDFHLIVGDMLDQSSLVNILSEIKPDEVYNLAAQSFVGESWNQPIYTGEVTGLGTLRLLEAIRLVDSRIKFYQASSSEMFGKVNENTQSESTRFCPRSPYGAAKLYAHWITVNYRESYDMFTVSGILFNHESPRRGVEFVTRKITQGVALVKAGFIREVFLGNLDSRRDWGYAGDYVEAMWLMMQQERPKDYIVATGETHSVEEFAEAAFERAGLNWTDYVKIDPKMFRPAEIHLLCGDSSQIRNELGWKPKVEFRELVNMMVDEDLKRLGVREEKNETLSQGSHAYLEIKKCRSCKNENLSPILSLGNLFVSDFIEESELFSEERPYPLELVLCNNRTGGCGLLQLHHTVSPSKMYRNYWYRSGVNKTMIDELNNIASMAEKIVRPGYQDIVVDIGCNDGTLLRAYTSSGIQRIGYEPARNLMEYARKGTDRIFNDFFDGKLYKDVFGEKKAKIVTAIAMFYDLDEPNVFVGEVKEILDKEGVWIVQMTDLPSMLVLNAFDNICHEHLEYYSLSALEHLLTRHDLEIFDLETNDINGGSLRVYIRHKGSNIGNERVGRDIRIAERVAFEEQLGLNDMSAYFNFAERVRRTTKSMCDFIKKEKAKGKKIFAYGASTKGNTLLQYLGLNHTTILAAAERNPIKWGKKTIGTNIPIISEEEARLAKPDYFLVLPWHFMREFLDREVDYLKGGGKFIVPLPEFKIIGKD